MIKTRKTLVVFLLIIVQSALAVTAGVIVLSNMSLSTVPACIYADEMPLGGISYNDAEVKIENYYTNILNNSSLMLDTGDDAIH